MLYQEYRLLITGQNTDYIYILPCSSAPRHPRSFPWHDEWNSGPCGSRESLSVVLIARGGTLSHVALAPRGGKTICVQI